MGETRISFELRNSLSELETLCQNLEHFGQSLGLSQRVLFEINLALEELVTNIISYGYEDDAEHWIKVAISHDEGMLIINLEDDGIPFDPLQAEEPDCQCPAEQRKVGNLGIFLTRQFVNEIGYERRGNKNSLTIRKKVAGI
jgi:anti-sigma regulatory factor (Ser/Thr protein kinase)